MISLVTGGAGFIGSHVTKHLLNRGHQVIVLDDLSGGLRDQVDQRATFIQGSILDEQLIAEIFKDHKIDYVFHLAAYAAEGLSHFIRKFNYENNLIGSANLINASVNNKVKSFVFTSSIAVYGSQNPPMTEDMLPMPEDPYGIAKYAVEMDLKCAHDLFGMNYVVFRPHNVYGENQNIGDRYRNVVGIFMNQLMKGEPLSIYGDGIQTRAFSYIDDVAPIIAMAVETNSAQNQIFNIGGVENTSVKDLAQTVMKSMRLNGEIKHFAARNETEHAFSDHSKLERIFGTLSKTPLEKGLKNMAEWAKSAGSKPSKKFKNIEILDGLPANWSE